jgi:hypothetical protein
MPTGAPGGGALLLLKEPLELTYVDSGARMRRNFQSTAAKTFDRLQATVKRRGLNGDDVIRPGDYLQCEIERFERTSRNYDFICRHSRPPETVALRDLAA